MIFMYEELYSVEHISDVDHSYLFSFKPVFNFYVVQILEIF